MESANDYYKCPISKECIGKSFSILKNDLSEDLPPLDCHFDKFTCNYHNI